MVWRAIAFKIRHHDTYMISLRYHAIMLSWYFHNMRYQDKGMSFVIAITLFSGEIFAPLLYLAVITSYFVIQRLIVNHTLHIEPYSLSGKLVPRDISPRKSPSERGCPSGIYLHLTSTFYRATMMYRPRQLHFSFSWNLSMPNSIRFGKETLS